MKVIQTIYDIKELKERKPQNESLPPELIEVVEQDFLDIYESGNENVYLMDFYLPHRQALILLEQGDDVLRILDDLQTIEYVEKAKAGRLEYYRITKRIEHEFQLIYSLVGIHEETTEKWLEEQAAWNERG